MIITNVITSVNKYHDFDNLIIYKCKIFVEVFSRYIMLKTKTTDSL